MPSARLLMHTARQFAGALMGAAAMLVALTPPASAQGMIRDAEIEETLRDFGTPIWKAAGLDPSGVTVIIVSDPDMNAFVAEGQNIFIHTGLILATQTPNQLKGVIAHETGHIAGGHLARSDQAMSAAMAPAFISIGLGILAMAAGAPDAGAALIGGSTQFAMGSYMRFSQVQESSADQAGATFLEESGQSGVGLMTFFEKFRSQELMSSSRRSGYFRTHPLSSDRIAALRNRVSASAHKDVKDSPEDVKRFEMMKAKLYGFLEAPSRTLIKYPESDTSMPARYARALADYRIPDTGKAVKEITALTQAEPNNPYFQELWGQVLFESGKAKDAIPHDREAVRLKPANALLLTNLGRSLNGVGDQPSAKEAISILQRAVQLEPDNGYAWREMASAYDTIRDEGMARLATAEEAFSLGDYSRALNFATRAKQALPAGQSAWRRASDIILISETKVKRQRG